MDHDVVSELERAYSTRINNLKKDCDTWRRLFLFVVILFFGMVFLILITGGFK